MKYLLFTALFLLGFSNAAKAEYILNTDVKYYSVNEADPAKLLAQVTKVMKKPCNARSAVFACMRTSIKTTHKAIEVEKGVCGLYRFKLTAKQQYLIPKWENRGQHSIEMQNKWIDLLNNRTAHEKNYGEIFKQTMLKAHNKIMKLTTRCSKIKYSIDKILSKANKEAKEKYKEFDEQSGNYTTNFPN